VLQAKGDVLAFLDRRDEALEHYDKAFTLFQTVGDRLGQANVLLSLGRMSVNAGQYDQALGILAQARSLYVAVGAQSGLANVSIFMAQIAAAQGDFAAAADYMQPAADFGKAVGHPLGDQLQAQIDAWRAQAAG
ncbi:MAG: tetratricopeptide repeat protein, partial [Caldilineales bacterium]|nr:tetratricopeptide repeat protein [Caldilineales bacterium]